MTSSGGAPPARVLLLFVDGVGIGGTDPSVNPLAAARLPRLRALLGGGDGRGVMVPADAALGVPGLPQSGTGQTALLTGVNAAQRFGRHFGPWVPTGLRELLCEHSLLQRAVRAGRAVAFANAYPARHLLSVGARLRRPAAPPLAARAAGVLVRDEAALRAGRAVTAELTNDRWRMHLDPAAPAWTPVQAGAVLAGICAEAELTLFAHYDTDTVGHRGSLADAVAAVERVDQFLGGVLDHLPADALLVVASDHGNLEDVRGGHTRNPVPVIAAGPGSRTLAARVHSITDVAPAILNLLDVD